MPMASEFIDSAISRQLMMPGMRKCCMMIAKGTEEVNEIDCSLSTADSAVHCEDLLPMAS